MSTKALTYLLEAMWDWTVIGWAWSKTANIISIDYSCDQRRSTRSEARRKLRKDGEERRQGVSEAPLVAARLTAISSV